MRERTAFAIVLIALLGLLLWGPEWMLDQVCNPWCENYPVLADEYRRTLAQIAGGVILLGTLYVHWRAKGVAQGTLLATSDRLAIERFAKGVELIGASAADGSPQIATRVGGLFALERLAAESPHYHSTVYETVCAYIKLRSKLESEEHRLATPAKLEQDVVQALRILGRRDLGEDRSDRLLDLSGCDLRGVSLPGSQLGALNLRRCDLTAADFSLADLSGSDFRDATVRSVDFTEANLERVRFDNADLSQSVFVNARVANASFEGAITVGTYGR